ncbi:hypothetical protein NBRC13719_42480 (plasmid) [Bacillus subtilis subsp. subtilis]|nr:hypothetical protein NBRC13719_42480 [Bacillus subtilis subsp. subtilis]
MLIAYSGGKKFKDEDVSFFVMFLRHKINDINKHKNIYVAVQIFHCLNGDPYWTHYNFVDTITIY